MSEAGPGLRDNLAVRPLFVFVAILSLAYFGLTRFDASPTISNVPLFLAQAGSAYNPMALDTLCPTGPQYDYSCPEGQKSADPTKTCIRGKEVTDGQIRGVCTMPAYAAGKEYKDIDGTWKPVQTPDSKVTTFGTGETNQFAPVLYTNTGIVGSPAGTLYPLSQSFVGEVQTAQFPGTNAGLLSPESIGTQNQGGLSGGQFAPSGATPGNTGYSTGYFGNQPSAFLSPTLEGGLPFSGRQDAGSSQLPLGSENTFNSSDCQSAGNAFEKFNTPFVPELASTKNWYDQQWIATNDITPAGWAFGQSQNATLGQRFGDPWYSPSPTPDWLNSDLANEFGARPYDFNTVPSDAGYEPSYMLRPSLLDQQATVYGGSEDQGRPVLFDPMPLDQWRGQDLDNAIEGQRLQNRQNEISAELDAATPETMSGRDYDKLLAEKDAIQNVLEKMPQPSQPPVFNETTGKWEKAPPQFAEMDRAAPLLGGAADILGPGTTYDDQGNPVYADILDQPVYPLQEFKTPPLEDNIAGGFDGAPLPGPIPPEYQPVEGEKFIVDANGNLHQQTPSSESFPSGSLPGTVRSLDPISPGQWTTAGDTVPPAWISAQSLNTTLGQVVEDPWNSLPTTPNNDLSTPDQNIIGSQNTVSGSLAEQAGINSIGNSSPQDADQFVLAGAEPDVPTYSPVESVDFGATPGWLTQELVNNSTAPPEPIALKTAPELPPISNNWDPTLDTTPPFSRFDDATASLWDAQSGEWSRSENLPSSENVDDRRMNPPMTAFEENMIAAKYAAINAVIKASQFIDKTQDVITGAMTNAWNWLWK